MSNKLEEVGSPEYLGDGVYVKLHSSGDVVLFTSNGFHTTNSVFLEPKVLREFVAYCVRNKLATPYLEVPSE